MKKKPSRKRPVLRGPARRKGEVGKKRDSKKDFIVRAATGLVLILFFIAVLFLLPPFALSTFMGVALLTVFFVEWPRLFPCTRLRSQLLRAKEKKTCCIGNMTLAGGLFFLIYPTIPFILAVMLNQNLEYRKLLFYMALSVSLFDFGSYAFGSLFGKNKIAPSISPRKTWEGAIGGYLVVTSMLFFLFWRAGTNMAPLISALLISLCVCALALSGDLFESFLKRRVGIKDTASFLPGHGGFMDRFDAMLFAIPFFYFFKEFLGYLFGLV